MEGEFSPVSIDKLNGEHFNVPAYQRGYRWEEKEIENFLEDVVEFKEENRNDVNAKYCLQPLVVRYDEEKEQWDLIDGQQRLTTLYILLQLARTANPDGEYIKYTISYESRENSKKFLEEEIPKLKDTDDRNPDFYFMSKAKTNIEAYLEKNKDRVKNACEVYKIFEEKALFIWYEVNSGIEPIEMFQKLNVGKIELTNAELVKAVLLNKKNYNTDEVKDKEEAEKEALIDKARSNMASRWDFIEQSLANDDFWFFIANEDYKNKSPRIELVLDAVADDITVNTKKSSFEVFYEEIKKGKNGEERAKYVDDLWKKVSAKHSQFREWFENDEWYHYIGFLIRAQHKRTIDISRLIKDKRKSEILVKIKDEIRKWKYLKNKKDALDTISYEDDKEDLRAFFLLINILTVLKTKDKTKDSNAKTITRFPFDKYEKQKWDIEHIHARADKKNESDEVDDSIRNLTLLDRKTNREYKDAKFPVKRKHIRETLQTDRFVPICTQNVFFKVYTEEYKGIIEERDKIEKINEYKEKWLNLWNELDKLFYEQEIKNLLNYFYED